MTFWSVIVLMKSNLGYQHSPSVFNSSLWQLTYDYVEFACVCVCLGGDRHVILMSLRKCFTLLPYASGMGTGSNQGCVFLIDGAIIRHKRLHYHWTKNC